MPLQYDPAFEAALEKLLIAATDTAKFAPGLPTGRSRQASIRRLAEALAELHAVAAAVLVARDSPPCEPQRQCACPMQSVDGPQAAEALHS